MAKVMQPQRPELCAIPGGNEATTERAAIEAFADLVAEDWRIRIREGCLLVELAQLGTQLWHQRNRSHPVSLGRHQPTPRPVRPYANHISSEVNVTPREGKRLAASEP